MGGTDYISKVFQARYHEIQQKYDTTVSSMRDPTYEMFLKDNLFRIFGLNAIDRLIAAYQVYPLLKARFSFPGTLSHTFTEITNEGLFSGILKGSLLSTLQLSLVLFPSVYIANKSENKLISLLTSYTMLDTIMYPIDSLKNILYAETHHNLNFKKVIKKSTIRNLYNGLLFKLGFNIPFLTSMYLSTQGGSEHLACISWFVTVLMYPLTTIKIRNQL